MMFEGFYGLACELHAPPGAGCLRGREDRTVLRYGECATDLEGAVFEVYVIPLQTEQLSLTETGVYSQHVEGFEPVPGLVRHLEQELGLLRRERVHLFPARLRRLHGLGGIARNQAIHNRLFESLVQRSVNVADSAGRRSRLQLLPVEAADVRRCQGLELDSSEGGLQMYARDLLVSFKRRGFYGVAHGIREPAV